MIGDDFMGAIEGVCGFRVIEPGTVEGITIFIDEPNAPGDGDAVFNISVDGTPLFSGVDRPKIVEGDVSVTIDSLEIDLVKGNRVLLNLESGKAKAPVEVGFSFVDAGGGGGGDGTIAGKPVIIPDDFTGLNGNILQFSEELDSWVVLPKDQNPPNPNADFPTGLPVFAAYEAFRETGLINGDSVGQLTDLASGSNRHALQATVGLKPIFATNQLNGKAGYVFDRTNNQNVVIPSMTGLSQSEIWHVVQVTTASGSSETAIHQFGSDTQSNHYPYTDGNNYDNGGSNARKQWSASGADSRVFHLGAWVNVSGEFTYYYNGTQKYTTAANTPGLIAAPTIGKAGTTYCSLILCGTYIFDTKLTGIQRTTMKNYINNVFGLTLA